MKLRAIRKLLFVFVLFFMYRNRYKLMNTVLQNETIRKFAVSLFMKSPLLRNGMIFTLFRKKVNSEIE